MAKKTVAKGHKDGFIKGKAYTVDSFPGQKCMSSERGNEMGSHVRMSGKHNQGARGKHNTLRTHGGDMIGGDCRTFRKGLPHEAPAPIGGGKKHG